MSCVLFLQSFLNDIVSSVVITLSILFWMNTILSTQLVKVYVVGTLGCLSNILFCPYKSLCPKRIQFHSVIYSLPHSYVLQENCALFSALGDSEAIMTTTFLGTSQMGLVICMWANADLEPLRKSSRDFLRKRSINKQRFPLLPQKITVLDGMHWPAATVFHQPEDETSTRRTGWR